VVIWEDEWRLDFFFLCVCCLCVSEYWLTACKYMHLVRVIGLVCVLV
jgi:hypothetical protein